MLTFICLYNNIHVMGRSLRATVDVSEPEIIDSLSGKSYVGRTPSVSDFLQSKDPESIMVYDLTTNSNTHVFESEFLHKIPLLQICLASFQKS